MNLAQFNELSPAAKQRAFHAEHGKECYRDGSTFYYSDGAVMDGGGDPTMCIYYDPPDPTEHQGEYLLYWRKLKFAQLKLKRAVDEFDKLNTHLQHGRLPTDPDAALAELKKLQAKVDERKAFVAAAEKALANTRRSKWQAQARAEQEEENRRLQEFHDKRRAIRV